MYRLKHLLVEEAVAKVEGKSPESDRQATEALAVSTGFLTGLPSSSRYHACKPALPPWLMASCTCERVTLAVAW